MRFCYSHSGAKLRREGIEKVYNVCRVLLLACYVLVYEYSEIITFIDISIRDSRIANYFVYLGSL